MNSMTGYGRATTAVEGRSITVQVTSVNRKSLDLTVGLPESWEAMEPAILEAARKAVLRGKVHLVVEATGAGGATDWDPEVVADTIDRLARLAEERGVKFEPTAELLWQVASARGSGAVLPAAEVAAGKVLGAVQQALRELRLMRATEGEALLVDFLGRLERLRQGIEAIAARAPRVAPAYGEQLLQRLRSSGLELDLADERVLKEIALFADRCDVTEEITRLRSHLAQLTDLLRSEGEVGRKAEFILQEIGREVHTVGSKANDLAIAQQVIELKNELERVREQVANVE